MPCRALAQCSTFGCPHTAPCPLHGRQARLKQWDAARGTKQDRGYGPRWERHRKVFIALLFQLQVDRAGLCGARLPGARLTQDSDCARMGLIARGVVVDHIVPVTGPNDSTFWRHDALQLLCRSCDAKKRQREGVALRVAGQDVTR